MRRGQYAQEVARRHIEGQGYRILEENYRCRWGELDIVALEGACLVAVEVRSRSSSAFGSPEESITPAKARRLAILVDAYRADRAHLDLPVDSRIDLIAVDLSGHRVTGLRLIKDAVGAVS
jgi:putative endonuclease